MMTKKKQENLHNEIMRSNLHTLAGRPGISNDLIVLMAFLLLKKKYSKQTKFSIFYTITQ